MTLIYKICPRALWRDALDAGVFAGAPVDVADGFIHLSTADQVVETAARHFSGIDDLVLLAIASADLGGALRFEVSCDGALFPHLYAALSVDVVSSVVDLPLGPDGRHLFPAHISTDVA